MHSYCRLNKIGKNPLIVSNRANLESDCKQMNDIVKALSQAEIDSVQSTFQRPGTPHIYNELQQLGRILAFPGLRMGLGEPPGRAHSHGDVSSAGTGEIQTTLNKNRTMMPKESLVFQSDIYLERPPVKQGVPRQGPSSQGGFGGSTIGEMRITENSTYNSLTRTAVQRAGRQPSYPSLAINPSYGEAVTVSERNKSLPLQRQVSIEQARQSARQGSLDSRTVSRQTSLEPAQEQRSSGDLGRDSLDRRQGKRTSGDGRQSTRGQR